MRVITDDISKYDEKWWDNLYSAWSHGEVEHEIGHYKTISDLIGEGSTLEVGCGMGHYSKYAKGKYVGIDWSKKAIDKAKLNYPGVDFRNALHGDIKEKFDAVVMFEVFEHVEDPRTMVMELAKIGKSVYVGLPEGEYSLKWVETDREMMEKYNPGATEYHYAVYSWEDIKLMLPGSVKLQSDDYSILFKYEELRDIPSVSCD